MSAFEDLKILARKAHFPERDKQLVNRLIALIEWTRSDAHNKVLDAENRYHGSSPLSVKRPGDALEKFIPKDLQDFLKKLLSCDTQGYKEASIFRVCKALSLLTGPACNYVQKRYLPKTGFKDLQDKDQYDKAMALIRSVEAITAPFIIRTPGSVLAQILSPASYTSNDKPTLNDLMRFSMKPEPSDSRAEKWREMFEQAPRPVTRAGHNYAISAPAASAQSAKLETPPTRHPASTTAARSNKLAGAIEQLLKTTATASASGVDTSPHALVLSAPVAASTPEVVIVQGYKFACSPRSATWLRNVLSGLSDAPAAGDGHSPRYTEQRPASVSTSASP